MIGLSLAATGLGMAIVQGMLTGHFVRRLGEWRTALFGLCVAIVAYVAYAFIPQGWMVFPITFVGALQALAFPALNALMSHRVRPDQQGELQGAVASIMSLSSIIGPFLMTQALSWFTAANTPMYFPGAPFILAALLTLIGFAFLLRQAPQPEPSDSPESSRA